MNIFFKLLFHCVFIAFALSNTSASSSNQLTSRIQGESAVSCYCSLNKYAHEEWQLGYEYLDMAIYFEHDQEALHGFSKLFKKHWKIQVENMYEIHKYLIKRGRYAELFNSTSLNIRDSVTRNNGPLHQVALQVVLKLLEQEKELNKRLIELSKCASNVIFQKEKEKEACLNSNTAPQDKLLHIDPALSHFLDENFLGQKVERIKQLSDLYARLHRTDIHIQDQPHKHKINSLVIHLIDKELQDQFETNQ